MPITYFKIEQAPDSRITKLAFLDRFTDAEAIQIDLAGIGETVEAAAVRRYMSKIANATFVDLTRQDTVDGVNGLVALELLTQTRADEILTATVQDSERFRG